MGEKINYSNASVEFICCKEKRFLLQVGYKTDLCVGHLLSYRREDLLLQCLG